MKKLRQWSWRQRKNVILHKTMKRLLVLDSTRSRSANPCQRSRHRTEMLKALPRRTLSRLQIERLSSARQDPISTAVIARALPLRMILGLCQDQCRRAPQTILTFYLTQETLTWEGLRSNSEWAKKGFLWKCEQNWVKRTKLRIQRWQWR